MAESFKLVSLKKYIAWRNTKMADWQQEIRTGQSIWDGHNGIIEGLDYPNKLVYVSYYDRGYQTYEFDDLFGNWDDKLKQWVLVPL